MLHALFPPRITPRSEQSGGTRVDRACVLSSDFYWHLLAGDGTLLPAYQREKAVSTVPLRLDWDLFVTESIAIFGFTVVGFAACELIFRSLRSKFSEQFATGNRP